MKKKQEVKKIKLSQVRRRRLVRRGQGRNIAEQHDLWDEAAQFRQANLIRLAESALRRVAQ